MLSFSFNALASQLLWECKFFTIAKSGANIPVIVKRFCIIKVEPQWLKQLWNHENMFVTGVARVNEC